MQIDNRGGKTLAGIPALTGLVILFSTPAFAHSGGFGDWHMGRWVPGGGGTGGLGMIFMLLFWGLIIAAVVLAVRWLADHNGGVRTSCAGAESRALDILKERFAKGEISRAEFESMKAEIR